MDHKLEFPSYEEMHEKAVKLAHLIKEKNIKFDNTNKNFRYIKKH